MGVFNNTTKIGRRIKDPLTDKSLPFPGTLAYGSMTSPLALKGTNGIDCKLVHGDRWQEILGKMTEHCKLDVKTTFDQNWTIWVGGIMSLTVVKGYNEEMQGPVNKHFLQVVTELYDSDHNVTVPDSAAFVTSMYSNTLVKAEAIAIVLGFQMAGCVGLCLTIVALFDLEYKTLHAEFHPLHGDGKLVELYAVEAKTKLQGDKATVGAETNVKASLNAGVDIDAGVPFT